MEVISSKQFDFGEIFFTSDTIFIAHMKDNTTVDINVLQTIQSHLTEVAGNKKLGMITVFEGVFHTNAEAREFLSKNGHPNRYAIAFVSASLGARIIFNFFAKMNKPDVPSRLFSSEVEAYEWLLTQKPA